MFINEKMGGEPFLAMHVSSCFSSETLMINTTGAAPCINVRTILAHQALPALSPFVAQVRPYPDKCLAAWNAGEARPGAVLSAACSQLHATLHDRLAPCADSVARQAGIRKVFLMTHPMILPQVTTLLQQVGQQCLHVSSSPWWSL
jgi:hypothetical protein